MKTLVIAAPKGGSGKSTTTLTLAARAVEDGLRVAMYDLNADQASLTGWWFARGEPENPALFDVQGKVTDEIELTRENGFDWLIIDTPPLDLTLVENVVMKASVVVIPVRASIFDIGAIGSIVEISKKWRKPHAFVMSALDARHKKLNEQAKVALAQEGRLLAHVMQYSDKYISALTSGQAGFEIDNRLRPEVDGLWAEVQTLAAPTLPTGRILRGARYGN